MSYVYLSDVVPASATVSDATKVQALEAQAADLQKTADSLQSSQPAVATALKTQADALRKAATAFRQATGLPDPSALSTGAKFAIGAGLLATIGGAVWAIKRHREASASRFNCR